MLLHNLRNIILMKYMLKKFSTAIILCVLLIPVDVLTMSQCKITPTQIIKIRQGRDAYDNDKIYASVGIIVSDTTTWVQTTISDGVSITYNFGPLLISNALGDVVVAWLYIDSFGICQIAASILLHGTTAWHSSTISQGGWDARVRDYDGAIDENGNAIVYWTGLSTTDQSLATLAATASLSTSTIWSDQFLI
jgi:hypothetical protein